GDDYAEEPENLLYNGAYVLDEWNHGEGWTMKKNEDYFNADEVTMEEAQFQVVKDPKTALKLYRSEEHTSELQSRFDLVCRLLLDSTTSTIYTLSLHDALPIWG